MKLNFNSLPHRILLKATVAIVSAVIAVFVGILFLQVLTPFIRLQMEALQSDILAATTTVVILYVVRGAYLCFSRGMANAITQRTASPDPKEGDHA